MSPEDEKMYVTREEFEAHKHFDLVLWRILAVGLIVAGLVGSICRADSTFVPIEKPKPTACQGECL